MADGIPFTPAPRYEQQNPLQNISNMQGLAQREQAMELQAIDFAAKQAVGQHMQNAINPETGEFDKNSFVKTLATDPKAATQFLPVMRMLAEQGEIDARTVGQHLTNVSNQMELTSRALSPLLEKVQRGENVSQSDWAGAVGRMQTEGVFDKREDGIKALLGASQMVNPKDPQGYNRLVMGLIGRTQVGQELIKSHGLDIERNLTPRTTVVGGVAGEMPSYETPFSPPGARQLYGQQPVSGTAAEGTSAPRSGMQVGQGESPSAPPATFMPTEADPRTKQLNQYLSAAKDEDHWLRKAESEAQETANMSAQFETALHQQADALKNFEQGPLMDARVWTAEKLEGAGLPQNVVNYLMGAKNKGMDAVAAAQVARKGIYDEMVEKVRNLPGLSRLAVFELQQAKTAIPTLDTKKEAADEIFKNLQNTIKIANRAADLTERYAQWSVKKHTHERAFSKSALEDSIRFQLKKEGLLREGPITTKGEK